MFIDLNNKKTFGKLFTSKSTVCHHLKNMRKLSKLPTSVSIYLILYMVRYSLNHMNWHMKKSKTLLHTFLVIKSGARVLQQISQSILPLIWSKLSKLSIAFDFRYINNRYLGNLLVIIQKHNKEVNKTSFYHFVPLRYFTDR